MKDKDMKKYLAVDIGGSKTHMTVFCESGVIYEDEVAGVGLAAESDADLPEYREALSRIEAEHKILSVSVNLGGKNASQIRRVT